MKRGGRLPAMSAKRRDEMEQRRVVVASVLARDGHQCQARTLVPWVACDGPLDVHEVIPRSAWAKGYLEPTNCLAVCRWHHDWVDRHPESAHAVGLHRYSYERTTDA